MAVQEAGIPKEIKVERKGRNHSHYSVDFTTGGQLPESLKGLFTTKRAAYIAINTWKATKKPLRTNPLKTAKA